MLTSDGLLPIEDVKAGQLVWSYDTITGENSLAAVSNPIAREVNTLVEVIVGTELILTTTEHPFYVNGHWVVASELKVVDELKVFEDVLATDAGKSSQSNIYIRSVQIVDTTVTVYNFTVKQNSNYYISQSRVLVHNIDCRIFKPITTKGAKYFNKGLKDVQAGNGTPQTHVGTTQQKVFGAREYKAGKEGYGSKKVGKMY